ncbi:MBL fold metallo-hydrolase [Patescibacteria group bacterium]
MSKFHIERLVVGEMKTNCYIIANLQIDKCIIIDPGDEADYIQRTISDLGASPVAILATHGHFDHIMAARELKLAYNIPFVCNPKDKFLLSRLRKTARYFLKVDTLPAPQIDMKLVGDYVFGACVLQVILSPGHTPGSVCLYEKSEKILFSGDLIFSDGYVGRTDFEYANENELRKSIMEIRKLPKDTTVLPGHGEAFLLN